MFQLDNRTILFVQVLMGSFSAVYAFFPSKRTDPQAMGSFRAANLNYLLGFGLLFFQGILGIWLTVILANTFILLGFYFFCRSTSAIHEVPWNHRWLFLILPVHLLSFIFFTYVVPHTFIRIMIISTEIVILIAISLIKLKERHRQDQSVVHIMLVVTQLGYLFFLIFRMILTALLHLQIESIFNPDRATSIIFLSTIAYHISINLVVFLSLVWKYDEDIKERIILLEETHQDLTELNSLSLNLETKDSLMDLYQGVGTFMKEHFEARAVGIYIKDRESDFLKLVHISGFPLILKPQLESLPIDENTMSGRAALLQREVITTMENYPESSLKDALIEQGIAQVASYPIFTAKGTPGNH